MQSMLLLPPLPPLLPLLPPPPPPLPLLPLPLPLPLLLLLLLLRFCARPAALCLHACPVKSHNKRDLLLPTLWLPPRPRGRGGRAWGQPLARNEGMCC